VRQRDKEQLVRHLETIAQALKAYGKDLLLGNPESFTELQRHRRREIEIYALERELRRARPVAQAAWDAREYAGVVKAFGPLRDALTPAEAERLKFAEEQAGSK
jgi:hypothetical protein